MATPRRCQNGAAGARSPMMRPVLWLASMLLRAVYLLLPVASIVVGRRGDYGMRRFVVGGWLSGAALASGLLVIYSIGLGGRPTVWQAMITVYWGVGIDANIVTASLKAVISAVNRA